MMRVIRNLLFFLAGFACIFHYGLSYAETQPATMSYTYAEPTGFSCAGYTLAGRGSCSVPSNGGITWIYAADSSHGDASGWGVCNSSPGVFRCTIVSGCPSGYQKTANSGDQAQCRSVDQSLTCPSTGGWTLNGSTCTRPDCPVGQMRNTEGLCVPAYKTCASLVVTTTGSCVKSVPCGEDSALPLDAALQSAAICSDQKNDPTNCAASGGIVIGTFQGKPICLSPPPDDPTCTALGGTVTGTLNGQPVCSNIAGNPPCPGGGTSSGTLNGQPVCSGSCGAGSAPGTVNGVESCYPIAPTTTKKTTQSSNSPGTSTTTTGNDPNNPAGTSTKQEATQCDGSRCSTTTIINNGDGTSSTTTKQEDQGDYCKSNPKASVCSGETEQDKYCEDNPESLGCMKAGKPVEEGGLSTVDKSVVSTISPVNIASSAGCPADVQLGKGVYITYAGVCQYAEGLRPVVLTSAWLLAGLIVLGMTKGS